MPPWPTPPLRKEHARSIPHRGQPATCHAGAGGLSGTGPGKPGPDGGDGRRPGPPATPRQDPQDPGGRPTANAAGNRQIQGGHLCRVRNGGSGRRAGCVAGLPPGGAQHRAGRSLRARVPGGPVHGDRRPPRTGGSPVQGDGRGRTRGGGPAGPGYGPAAHRSSGRQPCAPALRTDRRKPGSAGGRIPRLRRPRALPVAGGAVGRGEGAIPRGGRLSPGADRSRLGGAAPGLWRVGDLSRLCRDGGSGHRTQPGRLHLPRRRIRNRFPRSSLRAGSGRSDPRHQLAGREPGHAGPGLQGRGLRPTHGNAGGFPPIARRQAGPAERRAPGH